MTALQTKADFDRLCKETDFTARFKRIMTNLYAHIEPSEEDITIADMVRDQGWLLVHHARAKGISRCEAGEIMNVLTQPLYQQRKVEAKPLCMSQPGHKRLPRVTQRTALPIVASEDERTLLKKS